MSRKRQARKPTRTNLSVLDQVCNLIPAFLAPKLDREFGVDKKARTFSPWSHLLALLYAQFTHAMSLIDVCDTLRHHATELARVRGATLPAKIAFCHANRGRDTAMAERLFWETLKHRTGQCQHGTKSVQTRFEIREGKSENTGLFRR
ncbi:MAG: DUF4372 domain-containing protein [Candidatus Sumerlaeota bacterium]